MEKHRRNKVGVVSADNQGGVQLAMAEADSTRKVKIKVMKHIS